MNNWSETELAFRCERLSVRLERLAQNFSIMATLSQDLENSDAVLKVLQESQSFLELTAIDLDVDSAFELAQMQRQLSRWHFHWSAIWTNDESRSELVTIPPSWANRVLEMSGVLV
jgi:hypothetical protein